MNRLPPYVAIVVLVLATGCTGEAIDGFTPTPDAGTDALSDAPVGPAGPVEIELVSDIDGTPIAPGDAFELVSGFQGGWHFEVYAKTSGATQEALSGFFRARATIGDVSIGSSTTEVYPDRWYQNADGDWVAYVTPIFANATAYPADWLGQTSRINFSLQLDDGTRVNDTLDVLIVDEIAEGI